MDRGFAAGAALTAVPWISKPITHSFAVRRVLCLSGVRVYPVQSGVPLTIHDNIQVRDHLTYVLLFQARVELRAGCA